MAGLCGIVCACRAACMWVVCGPPCTHASGLWHQQNLSSGVAPSKIGLFKSRTQEHFFFFFFFPLYYFFLFIFFLNHSASKRKWYYLTAELQLHTHTHKKSKVKVIKTPANLSHKAPSTSTPGEVLVGVNPKGRLYWVGFVIGRK